MDAKKWLQEHEQEMLDDICELIRIPSVTAPTNDKEAPFGKPCRECLDTALAIGERMGFDAINHQNYCGSLYWKGSETSEIGIFGHTDVVPAGNGWNYPPFEPTIENGLIIGRGSSDNKGSYMAALYALCYLKESGTELKHSVRFFLGCNEERGMEDIDYYRSQYKLPAFSLVPDVSFPVCNGEKGIIELELERSVSSEVLRSWQSGIMPNAVPAYACACLCLDEYQVKILRSSEEFAASKAELEKENGLWKISVHGIPAHAAFPEGSDSAEVKLAACLLESGVLDDEAIQVMQFITNCLGDYYGKGLDIEFEDKISGKLTHVGGIASFEDGVFYQNVNIRYNINADCGILEHNIRTKVNEYGFSIKRFSDSKPCYVDANNSVVQRLTEICNEELGLNLESYVMGGGTYARKLVNAVGYGASIPGKEKVFGPERGGAHQADEYVEIEDLRKAFLIYVKAIPVIDVLIE